MIRLAFVCCGLFGASPAESETAPALAAYEGARATAGRGAEAQVTLALWCEANGLTAERTRHLALAVLADPANAAARGLLGLAADGPGRWRRPEEVAARARAEASKALAEYNARRDRTAGTAEAQWKLALWCETNGLTPEAVAHLTAVTRLDPTRASAWKHLGFRPHNGRWMTPEQVASETAEAEARARADRHWRPLLERARVDLTSKDRSRRDAARARLAAVDDPRAVGTIASVLGSGPVSVQQMGVQTLGRVDTPAASRALAVFATDSPFEPVRRAAAETLRRRDPRDFVDVFIARLRDPIKYHVRPVGGPGDSGEILVEGSRFNLDFVYQTPQLPVVTVSPRSTAELDASGLLVINVANAVPGTAVFNSLTPAITWAMITQNLDPVFASAPMRPTRWIEEMLQPRGPQQVARVIGALLGPNSGLAAAPFILNPRAMWVGSPDGFQTQAPVAPGSPVWMPSFGGNSMPQPPIAVPIGRMVREVERTAYLARGQQRADVASLDRQNARIRRANDPVVNALTAIFGLTPGVTRSDLERWWTDQRGYALPAQPLASKPTVFEAVSLAYTPQPIGRFQYDSEVGYFTTPSSSCFGPGTPVTTLDGLTPIESVKVGDRVLSQDTHSGALSFQPVVAVRHNPPATVLKLTVGAESIVSTGIHRFWKARHGWVMARELKPGDEVRTLGGVARVSAVEGESTRPVFNLEVAGGHDFFVGTTGALVHDHTTVETPERPFDAGATAD